MSMLCLFCVQSAEGCVVCFIMVARTASDIAKAIEKTTHTLVKSVI